MRTMSMPVCSACTSGRGTSEGTGPVCSNEATMTRTGSGRLRSSASQSASLGTSSDDVAGYSVAAAAPVGTPASASVSSSTET
jgi:hypothetical protein